MAVCTAKLENFVKKKTLLYRQVLRITVKQMKCENAPKISSKYQNLDLEFIETLE